jgi:hypothetical protein
VTAVVWYWSGGREVGTWRAADPHCPVWLGGKGGDVAALVADIERGGRVAVVGTVAAGAPAEPPSAADWERVLPTNAFARSRA